jgi:hypothetical protein
MAELVFIKRKYQILKMTPFKMLEILIAHQTPSRPSAVAASTRAAGILRTLRVIPTTEGGVVLPSPIKAPAVRISRD